MQELPGGTMGRAWMGQGKGGSDQRTKGEEHKGRRETGKQQTQSKRLDRSRAVEVCCGGIPKTANKKGTFISYFPERLGFLHPAAQRLEYSPG